LTEHELDARGLSCPLPVLRTLRLLESLEPGDVVTVRATDPASRIDMRHFCNTSGHTLIDAETRDEEFVYRIRRREA